jgi:hypothetical protein
VVGGSDPDSVTNRVTATQVAHPSAWKGVKDIDETINQPHLSKEVRGEDRGVAVKKSIAFRKFGDSIARGGDGGAVLLTLKDTTNLLCGTQVENIVASRPEERAESRAGFDPPIVDDDFSTLDLSNPAFFGFLYFGDLCFEILDSKGVINNFSDLLIGGNPIKASSEHDLVEGDGRNVGELFATPNNKICLHYPADIEDEIDGWNVTK